jgi:DNA repair photolyase
VLIAPLMPGINDAPEQVEPLLDGAIRAGATSIGGIALHLRGELKDLFIEWLRQERPDLLSRYERLYQRGAYAPLEERRRLAALVRSEGRSHRFKAQRPAANRAKRLEAGHRADAPAAPEPSRRSPEQSQQRLF